MKLGISNIAFGENPTDLFWSKLHEVGVRGVEVAPTKVAPWETLNHTTLRQYLVRTSDMGFSIPSLQALFYGKDDLLLLGDKQTFSLMVEHFNRILDIANSLSAEVAVFGSPKNRNRGGLSHGDAWSLATERLAKVAELCEAAGVILAVEPVPECYGGDFLNAADDVVRLVNAIGSESLRVHLDVACVSLNGDSISLWIERSKAQLAHFHIAEPNLAPINPKNRHHQVAAMALDTINYEHWAVVEMRHPLDNWEDSVLESAHLAHTTYIRTEEGTAC
ncbi:sugar phosphate isomerase/epimerase [Rhizobium sp. PP-WC-2G-219]|nr:sugar phosphate isomerase/epimerase [Rhizobium sp. PP-WC-2G-219]